MNDLFLDNPEPAILSPDGMYRYRLTRRVGPGDKRMVVIMLNPSTADDKADDHTITKLIGFSKRWKIDIFDVVNLFAFRSTDPSVLALYPHTRIGPENDRYIRETVARASLNSVIVAWGANPTWDRDKEVLKMLTDAKVQIFCWGTTKKGAPLHPLLLAYTTLLKPYPGGV